MTHPSASVSVLFVCLGNICRSPMAEGVFLHLTGEDPRIRVDSAGTGAWHTGEAADARARDTAQQHGVHLPSRARQVRPEDFHEFDLIVAMDDANLRDLERLAERSGGDAELRLFREFDEEAAPHDREVPDPYYGGDAGFEIVFQMVDRASRGLLAHLESEYLGS
jgi:protein-tyrosine phosphatase